MNHELDQYIEGAYGMNETELRAVYGERFALAVKNAFEAGQEAGPARPAASPEDERVAVAMSGTTDHPLSYGAM